MSNEKFRRGAHCAPVAFWYDNSALGILFNIDNTSVTKSKQRIKKKLGLGPNDVLETFLNENKK